jgi:hypothetical protein
MQTLKDDLSTVKRVYRGRQEDGLFHGKLFDAILDDGSLEL